MNRKDVSQLLGGYATGTLTAEEREALYAAALEDQALFDALADEEALRELLADGGARARLRAALDEPRRGGLAGPLVSWWRRPAAAALAGAAAVILLAVALVRVRKEPAPERSVEMAALRQPVAPPQPVQAPAAAGGAVPESRPAFAPPAPRRERPVVFQAPRADQTAAESAAADLAAPKIAVEATPASPPQQIPIAEAAAAPPPAPPPPAAPRMRAMAEYDKARAPVGTGMLRANLAAAPQPELEATVLRAAGDDRFETVPQTAAVHTGERIRLEIASPVAGWIYIFEPAEERRWKMAGSGAVAPGKPFRYPAGGGLRLDEAGRREWLAVFSPGPGTVPPMVPPPRGALPIAIDVTRP